MKSRYIAWSVALTLAAQGCAPIGFSITTPSGDKPTYGQPEPDESDGELTPVGYALLGVGVTCIVVAIAMAGGKNPEATAAAFDQAARESKEKEICYLEGGCDGGAVAATGERSSRANRSGDDASGTSADASDGAASDGIGSDDGGVSSDATSSGSSADADAAGAGAGASGAGTGRGSTKAGATPAADGDDGDASGSGWPGGSYCAWRKARQAAGLISVAQDHCDPEHYRLLFVAMNLCVAEACASTAIAKYDELMATCEDNRKRDSSLVTLGCIDNAGREAHELAKSCRTPCPKTPSTGAGRAK